MLTQDERMEVVKLHYLEGKSLASLARDYGVEGSVVSRIINLSSILKYRIVSLVASFYLNSVTVPNFSGIRIPSKSTLRITYT